MADWSVAEAKAKFSEVIARAGSDGPQYIGKRGKPAAVLVSVEEWERLRPRRSLIDALLDPANRVLNRDEVDTLFVRDDRPDRPSPDFR